jgi:hypothetical protein
MTAQELVLLQEELEFLLRNHGPTEFLKDLAARDLHAQVRAYDSRDYAFGWRGIRFVYVDEAACEAFVTVYIGPDDKGSTSYALRCEPRWVHGEYKPAA